MKFGSTPIDDAEGLILAHTFCSGEFVLKKGSIVAAKDIAELKRLGASEIIGARLEPGDVPEDEAAARIAKKLCGDNVIISAARTGRCNLVAKCNGVTQINASEITAVNQINETVTVATLSNMQAVRANQIIATVKVIPFAVDATVMEHVEAALRKPAVALAPYKPKRFALLSTLAPGLKSSVVEATDTLTRRRVESVGGTVIAAAKTMHVIADVANEVKKAAAAKADVLLIIGASATVDRGDVIPEGIVAAGGVIDHFGMPVDPGNLFVLGDVKGMPVLVLPGCARSSKPNGVDWVMQYVASDIPIGHAEIMSMGVGGLLIDTPARPLPRDRAVKTLATTEKPKITALVLAAGQSRRMEGENKLLMKIDGAPLIRRTVETVMSSNVDHVVVVTGHQDAELRGALAGLDITITHNPNFAGGLSTSLAQGLGLVDSDAALVCLGDMPAVTAAHIDQLIAGFDPENGCAIGVPAHNGKRGNPVLWARHFFEDMCGVSGDVGARHLIGANESLVYEVEFGDTAVLTDLDTPEQWSAYLSKPT
jgi:molybdenum cofactor cytidylyltransferase